MARYSGVGLSVDIDDGEGVKTLKGVTSISDNTTGAITDVTGAESAYDWREFVTNLKTGTFTIEGHYDDAADATYDPPDMDWIDAVMTDVSLTYASGGPTLHGAAYIDSVGMETDIEGSTEYSITGTWNGEPTEG